MHRFARTWLVVTALLTFLNAENAVTYSEKEQEVTEALLRNNFPQATRVDAVLIPLQPADQDSLRRLTKLNHSGDTLRVLAASDGEKIFGFGVVDESKGKDQPITYCVIVDNRLTIRHVEILTYREPYGGEIRHKSWLNQFFGKGPEDRLLPARDIKNITGATISSRSVTLGVKKVLSLLHIAHSRLRSQVHTGR